MCKARSAEPATYLIPAPCGHELIHMGTKEKAVSSSAEALTFSDKTQTSPQECQLQSSATLSLGNTLLKPRPLGWDVAQLIVLA